jgi:hypothetical protein
LQSKSAAGTSLTLTSGTSAGSCLVVGVGDRNSIAVCTVTAVKLGGAADNFGSSAAILGGGSGSGNTVTSLWVDAGCAAGQTAVAATLSNSSDPVIFAFEIAGLISSPLDQTAASGSSSGSSYSSGSTATTSQPSEIWLGMAYTIVASPGSPSGYTNTSQSGSGTGRGIAGWQVVTSTGAAVYNSTIGATEQHSAAVLTLKASASGGLLLLL